MTLARLLDMAHETRAQDVANGDTSPLEDLFAKSIVDLLGGDKPIGIPEPPIVSFGDGTCGVLVDDRGDALTVEEARGYAAAILRAADEAEERNR